MLDSIFGVGVDAITFDTDWQVRACVPHHTDAPLCHAAAVCSPGSLPLRCVREAASHAPHLLAPSCVECSAISAADWGLCRRSGPRPTFTHLPAQARAAGHDH